jgi:hypothetical protein
MQHTRKVASLDSLQSQSGNQSSAYTATVFSGQDLNGILLLGVRLGRPVEDFAKGLGATGLEVRILVEDGTIRANMAGLVVLLRANGCNTAGRETGGTGTDELGESSNELQLGSCAGDVELGEEQIMGLLQVLKRVPAKMQR